LAAAPLELAPLAKQNWDCFETQWNIMTRSAALLTQALIPGMRKRGKGHLIYCLSAVTLDKPPKGMIAYNTAKYGLWGFARTVASECIGSGIMVNYVSPGVMNTSLLKNLPEVAKSQMKSSLPSQEFINPEAVARFIVQLLDSTSPDFHDRNFAVLSDQTSPS
jgi:3-oxoacyl-[acyl-carrier protein] reductase